jgi:hypothetical protein
MANTRFRYSGDAKITLTLQDNDSYRVVVETDCDASCITINSPKVLKHAIDSPEAFDDAARAAVAFALEERDEHGVSVFDDSDFAFGPEAVYVGRTREQAWPA